MLSAVEPDFNIDDVHRDLLAELLSDSGITAFSTEDRRAIAARWHELDAWPDFAPALAQLRQRYVCVSFTILSLSLVIDVSRRNGIDWDAVIPCEMLRVYKTRPEAYQRTAKLKNTRRNPDGRLPISISTPAWRSNRLRHRPAGGAGRPGPGAKPEYRHRGAGFGELAGHLEM